MKPGDEPESRDRLFPRYSNARELLVYKQTWANFFEEATKVVDQPEKFRKVVSRGPELVVTKSELVRDFIDETNHRGDRLIAEVEKFRECAQR